jgi:hypothetical protein
MSSILLPEMNGMLGPSLAILTIVVPLGLAYVIVMLQARIRDAKIATASSPRRKFQKLNSRRFHPVG